MAPIGTDPVTPLQSWFTAERAYVDAVAAPLLAGSGRGSRAVYYATNPAALHAIGTDSFGDLAYMETGGGMFGSWWGLDGGYGKWRPLEWLACNTRAEMDTFIAAVALAPTLTFYPFGGGFMDATTGVSYRFTSAAGAYAPARGLVDQYTNNVVATIVSTTFAAIPTAPSTVVVTPGSGARRVKVTVQCKGATAGGSIDVGIHVTGSTTILATETSPGVSDNAAFTSVQTGGGNVPVMLTRIVTLNAGANTIAVEARAVGAAGTKLISDIFLMVEPVQ